MVNVEPQEEEANVECQEEEVNVEPQDSVSNVKSKVCGKSSVSKSSRSSTSSSARLQAEAERAALLARAAALQKKHALEEQADQLRRQKEQLELETELAASAAKLSALIGSSCHASVTSGSVAYTDGMESYLKKGTELKHHVKVYNAPQMVTTQQKHLSANTHSNPIRPRKVDGHQTTSHQISQQPTSIPGAQQTTPAQDNPQIIGKLYNLLQSQTNTTALLAQIQCSQTLPHRDIPIFDGNPLQFKSFIRAFEQCIEAKTLSSGDRLYYLEQFTRGQPKDLVRSCQHMPPERGYTVAKDLLRTHFGYELKITAAYVDKTIGWPSFKAEDVKGLQAYALYLHECCNAMEELQYLDEFNMPANMKLIIQKLPYKLREKWRILACEISEMQDCRAGFKDVNFIEQQVKIISDPVFGDIQDAQVGVPKVGNRAKLQQKSQFKGNSFATTVSLPKDSSVNASKKSIHTQTQGNSSINANYVSC